MGSDSKHPRVLKVIPWLFILSPGLIWLLVEAGIFVQAKFGTDIFIALGLGSITETIFMYIFPIVFISNCLGHSLTYFWILVGVAYIFMVAASVAFLRLRRWAKVVLEVYCWCGLFYFFGDWLLWIRYNFEFGGLRGAAQVAFFLVIPCIPLIVLICVLRSSSLSHAFRSS